jgi:hypothetical protein
VAAATWQQRARRFQPARERVVLRKRPRDVPHHEQGHGHPSCGREAWCPWRRRVSAGRPRPGQRPWAVAAAAAPRSRASLPSRWAHRRRGTGSAACMVSSISAAVHRQHRRRAPSSRNRNKLSGLPAAVSAL